MSEPTCVIVGASHAGTQLALSLRQGGWAGRIVLIGDEPVNPYQRPPLSKDVLSGTKSLEHIPIRPASVLESAGIELVLGRRVEAIDRDSKRLTLDDGSSLVYDKLALTLGAHPATISLTGSDKHGVYYLRNLADVEQIQPYIDVGNSAVIVGGGYIGLEAGAILRQIGMRVTVLEALPRVLQRVTAPLVSTFYERLHYQKGLHIMTSSLVTSIEGDEYVERVFCADGSEFDANLVIIAVGVLPNTGLAERAGLRVEDGILVDEYTCTSDPDIVAAGDCTRHYNPIYRRRVRLESVQNAMDQARTAAATLNGNPEPYHALPWFWSDQYDVKLQIAGLSQGYDNVVIRGNPDIGESFAVFYFEGDRLLAVDAINRPGEFMLGKKLLMQGADINKARLADESITVKELLGA
ncbi:MAG: FAD-dependent oxidoreductase [Xanthomonadales bacterium]|nr:FAD-dependent oxidoreductase [Xanthomonadales bacterium]NNK51397.1 FAD-dependent oxidoreductase [Xanthomonadales bacterium]